MGKLGCFFLGVIALCITAVVAATGIYVYNEYMPWVQCSTQKLSLAASEANRYAELRPYYEQVLVTDNMMTNREFWRIDSMYYELEAKRTKDSWGPTEHRFPDLRVTPLEKYILVTVGYNSGNYYYEIRCNDCNLGKLGTIYTHNLEYYVALGVGSEPKDFKVKFQTFKDAYDYIIAKK